MNNNNGRIIRKISSRSLKQNKMRNTFAIAAIILTTLLFTALFTVGQGMIQLTEEQTMRQVGTDAHSGLKNVTLEQCEKICKNPLIVDWNYSRMIGIVQDERLSKRSAQVEWTTKKKMVSAFQSLAEGRLPEKEDEAVLDDIVIEMLGIPKKLGTTFDLSFTYLGELYHKTFTLCGWYEGDRAIGASSIYISDACFKVLCNGKTDEDLLKLVQEYRYVDNGLVQGNLYFKNSNDIEDKTIQVIEDAGYKAGNDKEEIDYGINWAYLSTQTDSVDAMTVGIVVLILVIILVTGYLVINNIFQISIRNDIRFYGLLKTIGTTKKQIAQMIRRQAFRLSIIGIPIGLLVGYFVGNFMLPVLFSMLTMNHFNFHMKFQPLVFLFSIIFSAVTVAISCHKPGKIAGSVSPVEAVRYQDTKVLLKGRKKRRSFGVAAMALGNLKRSRKKTILVVLSLAFSVIIMEEAVTFAKSFSMSKYLKEQIVDDIALGTASLYNVQSGEREYRLDKDYIEFAKNLDGISRLDEMYVPENTNYHYLSESGNQEYKKLYEQGKLNVTQYNQHSVDNVLEQNGSIYEERYAYSESLLEKLEVLEGSIDLEKFQSGKYIIVGALEEGASFYHPGDLVKLQYQTENSKFVYDEQFDFEVTNGHYTETKEKEFEVMAVVNIPNSLTPPGHFPNALYDILPIEELQAMEGNTILFQIGLCVEEDSYESVERQVKEYTEKVNPKMDYVSKESVAKLFQTFQDGMLLVGGGIAVVVGIIGILNFINTILTNVGARRRELAVMQSIGLSDQQMKKMLVYEGIYHIIAAMGLSIALGSVISVLFVRALNKVVAFFEYEFVWLPYVIIFPILMVTAFLIPYIAYKNTMKKSLVERLRENE